MQVNKIVVGPLRTNCYCVFSGKEAIIIDPGGNKEKILRYVEGYNVRAIVATHGHFDHVLEVEQIKRETKAPFMMHQADIDVMDIFKEYFSGGEIPKPDKFVDEGDVIEVGEIKLLVLHTPGHTPGSICIYDSKNKIVFTGDTLFKGAFGRTDLPFSDPQKIFDSLRKIFRLFTDDYIVYPGHGKSTTVGEERPFYLNIIG
ncbi:MAG: MBL fold metallo-hydrolase [Candidatus Njordarchaeota archaeon]